MDCCMSYSDIINIILSVLSFVLAVISVITVICTIKQNKDILLQNQEMIEAQSRPNLAVYPINDSSEHLAYLIIRNCGASQAIIKNITTDKDLSGKYYAKNNIDYLKMAIGSVIAPGNNIHCVFDVDKIKEPVNVSLEYESLLGKKYVETTPVNFHSGIVLPDASSKSEEPNVYVRLEHNLAKIKRIMEDTQHKNF